MIGPVDILNSLNTSLMVVNTLSGGGPLTASSICCKRAFVSSPCFAITFKRGSISFVWLTSFWSKITAAPAICSILGGVGGLGIFSCSFQEIVLLPGPGLGGGGGLGGGFLLEACIAKASILTMNILRFTLFSNL